MPQSITAKKGRNFLIKINATGVSPSAFTTLGGLRATDIALNGNPVDITNKGSGGWRELLPGGGVQQATISGSGVFDSASTEFKALQTAIMSAPALIEAIVISDAGDKFIGTWAVTALRRSGAHDNAEMYDLTLESSGPIIYATS